MLLRDILASKGSEVHRITPDATLMDVVDRLVQWNCGSLVVCDPDDPGQMIGIITERDILRACASHRVPLVTMSVEQCMTQEVITAASDQSLDETMGMMTSNRIRHLPVVEQGRLIGIISIGDVVKAKHDALSMENHYLKNYIRG